MSIPYGPPLGSPGALDPFWGKQTSHMSFCEEAYVITRYSAEFINAATSASYIIYGILGISRFKRRDVSIFSTVNWPYWALIAVGLASGLYHSTLKYHTQMGDEMSMYLAMGCALIQIFTFMESPKTQTRNKSIIVGGITIFIIYHCATDEFVMHVCLFITLTATLIMKTRKIIRETLTDKEQKRRLAALSTTAFFLALTAFTVWSLDQIFCSTLTRWKRAMGLPWGIVLEFHGWWHILTSISAYTYMAMIELLTAPEYVNESNSSGFSWPAKGVLEEIARERPAKETNGTANGKSAMTRKQA